MVGCWRVSKGIPGEVEGGGQILPQGGFQLWEYTGCDF